MSRGKSLRLVAIAHCKDEEETLEKWLQRTSQFVDGIIVLDDGSTDRSLKIIEGCEKVIQVLHNPPGGPMLARRDRNRLLDAARDCLAEWVIILDLDEIMDVRLRDQIDDLLSRPGVGRIYFKEVTLWRSNKYYRVDKPEMYNRDVTVTQMVRVNPGLRWVLPREHMLPWRLMRFLKTGVYRPAPSSGYMALRGVEGETLKIPELVKIHYHFVDWERAWRVHLRYAVREAIQFRMKLHEVPKIVEWASRRMDETGLQLAPVKPEWGVL